MRGWRWYAWTMLFIAVAAALKGALDHRVGPLPTYITFYPAVVLSAMLGGVGPGVLATLLGVLAADFLFMLSTGAWLAPHRPDIPVGMILFSSFGVAISLLSGRLRAIVDSHSRQALTLAEASAKAMKNLQAVFDVVNVGMLVVDENGDVRQANDAVSRWLGKNPETLGRAQPGNVLGCVHALNNPSGCGHSPQCAACPIRRTFQSVLADGRPVRNVETEAMLSVGGQENRLWFELNADPLTLDGKPHVILALNNISERKKRQEELQRLNRTLKALRDSSQAMLRATSESSYLNDVCRIVVEDCGHKLVWVGYAENDVGKTVRPVAYAGFEEGYIDTLNITWADTERGRGPTGTAIREGKPCVCANMQVDPRFQPWREEALKRGYASSVVLPLVSNGKAFGAVTIYSAEPNTFAEEPVGLLRELADDLAYGIMALRLKLAHAHAEESLRRAAEELARSNKDLEQFAYVASHDLQEPLRMVTGFVQLLQQKYGGRLDADAEQYIAFAVDGAKRMHTLINDLLTYSRVGARGKEPAPTDAGASLQRALDNLQASIHETGAEISHGELPIVRADGTQLTQLFQNLIGNAVKFRGAAPPKIHIDARRDGDAWRFSVRDNGIGIDPKSQERIFQVFQRLHSRQEYPGTGIGLAICQRIVERHGGRIWVESAPGEGATFHFTLPE